MILLLPLFSSCLASLDCSIYTCGSLPSSACFQYETASNTFTVQSCGRNEECLIYSGEESEVNCTSSVISEGEVHIGGECSDTCSSGSCIEGRCRGLDLDESCVSDKECDVGLHCSRNVCKPLIQIGDSGCEYDLDCSLRGGCNATNGRRNGQCVQYYSLKNGEYVSNCKDNFSNFCESGFCIRLKKYSGLGYCASAPVSTKRIPTECTEDAQCIGETNGLTFEGHCACGANKKGTAYCHPFPGDSPGRAYFKILAKIARKIDDDMCNTARRFDYDCVRQISKSLAEDFRKTELYMLHYPELQDNPNCVKRTLNYFYYYGDAFVLGVALWLFLY